MNKLSKPSLSEYLNTREITLWEVFFKDSEILINYSITLYLIN